MTEDEFNQLADGSWKYEIEHLRAERDALKFIAESFAAQEGREQELYAENQKLRDALEAIDKAAKLNQSTWGIWIREKAQEALG